MNLFQNCYRIFLLKCLLLVIITLLPHTKGTQRKAAVLAPEFPTFVRSAVESPPQLSSKHSLSYKNEIEKLASTSEYGSQALPIRTAVESVPVFNDRESEEGSIPIRTAVEYRPPIPPSRITKNRDHLQNTYIQSANTINDHFKIVCYIQASSVYRPMPFRFSPQNLDAHSCTHVIYAFATIDPHTFKMIPNDLEFDIIKGGYKSAIGLKEQNPNLKVLVSVGDVLENESHRFGYMIVNPQLRRIFIDSAIKFLKEHSFDGIDIHWQNQVDSVEALKHVDTKQALNSLLDEMWFTFKNYNWIISLAAPASRFSIDAGFDPATLGAKVDFINLQAYNFHRERDAVADHHSNLYIRVTDRGLDLFTSANYAVQYWIDKGFPRHKIVMGIPFFGRTYRLRYENRTEIGAPVDGPGKAGDYTGISGLLAYFEICDLITTKGLTKQLDSSSSPYITYGDQWISYDDPISIARKMLYVREMDLGGVHVWSADMDDFHGICNDVKWPLLESVNKNLRYSNDVAKPVYPVAGVCSVPNGLFSDPSDCTAYFLCHDGYKYHLSCGTKEIFDSSTGRCIQASLNAEKCDSEHVANGNQVDTEMLADLNVPGRVIESEVPAEPIVVCFMTNWAFYRRTDGKFLPEHIDQRYCTHVVYAFATLDPRELIMKEFDPWADLENNLYQRVTALDNTKVLIGLGGWTDSAGDKYSQLVGNHNARKRFVTTTIEFIQRHNFDGLHIDWNYPKCHQSNCSKGPTSDKENFAKLVNELRLAFNLERPKLLLAASISGYKEVIDEAYDLKSLGQDLDFMSVMTYDYHGSWESRTGHVSPLYGHIDDVYPFYNSNFTMEYLVLRGAPRHKLLLGIPFYGQTFTLSSGAAHGLGAPTVGPGEPGHFTLQPGMLAYYEICSRIKNDHWLSQRDADGSPYAYHGDQWVGYDDVTSVGAKADFVIKRGFGGAVAWTIDLDDFHNNCCGGPFALLVSLNKGLGRYTGQNSYSEDCTRPPTPVTPTPPITTTGSDSGAESSGEHQHEHSTVWWPTASPSTSSSTTSTTAHPTSIIWWQPATSTVATSTSTHEIVPSSTTSSPVGIHMPEIVESSEEDCPLGGYKEDPSNCNAYYRCIQNEWSKEYCAGGLHWNKATRMCDWPHIAKCNLYPNTPTTTTTTTEKTTTTQPSYTMADTKCISGKFYPHPHCHRFYICSAGELIPQSCSYGLVWNTDKNMCDWRSRVNCDKRKGIILVQQNHIFVTKESCQDNTYAPHPTDCHKYLRCLHGQFREQSCNIELHWSQDKKTCDWPHNANCDSSIIHESTSQSLSTSTTTTNRVTVTTDDYHWMSTTSQYPDWRPTTQRPTTTSQTPLTVPLKPFSGYFKIVCYFTNWAWYRPGLGKYLPEDIDYNLCSHIVYGFATLGYDSLQIHMHDSWADEDNDFYRRVTALKSKGVKVLLALGGWNDSSGDKYSRLVNSQAARSKFIRHAIKFLGRYNFDGLDLDWEYPKCWQVDCRKGPESDKTAFSAWLRELRVAFNSHNLLLSAAVSPSRMVVEAGYEPHVLGETLDWVAIMTYDFHGQWDKRTGHVAPLYQHSQDINPYFNANYSINYWIENGVPRRKIVMGMPMYGQSFRLEKSDEHGLNAKSLGGGEAGQFTRASGFLAYYEICYNILHHNWIVVQDPERTMGPYAYSGDQWVSFDDREMIERKSQLIRDWDLGGGMIWALDLDDFRDRCGGGRHPLLSTIRSVLADAGVGYVKPEQNTPPVFPNPLCEHNGTAIIIKSSP